MSAAEAKRQRGERSGGEERQTGGMGSTSADSTADLVIRNATIVDGTGAPPTHGDVAVGSGEPKSELLALASEVRARGIESVVVDTEAGSMRLGFCRPLSEALGATYLPIEQLRAGALVHAARVGLGRA